MPGQLLERPTDRLPHADSLVRRSQLEFHQLLEKLPAAAYTCDADGLLTYFNQRTVELWGARRS